MKTRLQVALFLLVLGLVASEAQDRLKAEPDWFDVPLEKKTLDFGPSFDKPPASSPAWQWNAYRHARNKLFCYWFPTVMVKQYDVSQKGAAWISFIRLAANAHPACTRSHVPGEKVFEAGGDWWGYFLGVKGDFVFVTDPDGVSGGIQFHIYDSRKGQQVFEDTDCLTCVHLKKMYGQEPPLGLISRMQINKTPDGVITLKYMRVEQADCDLRADVASCWEHVRKRLDSKNPKAPSCFGYDAVGYDKYAVGELSSMAGCGDRDSETH
jgi:hypothetical protein